MKTGTLYLIKSKNPPVFRTPMQVFYVQEPIVGESFLFSSRPFSRCNLSVTKGLLKGDGYTLITTRNSVYVLSEVEETDNAKA